MKKYFVLVLILLSCSSLFAKKIKFAVNVSPLYAMADSVHAAGIHIYGNFQGAAGYPFDWDPGSTPMIRETSDTMIYSIVVDIPPFYTYEYRFLNGDQAYEVEFVPSESRVNGNFDDNRWIYLDSLSNDTTFIGVLPYSANAPDGLTLVRFRVNMNQQTVNSDGVHVAGNFQSWNPATTRMGVVVDASGIYEYEAYLPQGTYQYKFVNGTTTGDYESVSGSCSVSGNREVNLTVDVMLDAVLFSSCLDGISENEFAKNISVYPNPAVSESIVHSPQSAVGGSLKVFDFMGKEIYSTAITTEDCKLKTEDWLPGIYFVRIKNNKDIEATVKLIVQ